MFKELKLYYLGTEGWVTEEYLLREYVRATSQEKQFEIFKQSITKKEKTIEYRGIKK